MAQMDERQKAMMQQAWNESKMAEMEVMNRQMAMEGQFMAEMEKAQAEMWKDDFIQNEVLNDRQKMMDQV